jgi:hypothetical protein
MQPLKVGQRIDVFSIIKTPYSTELFTPGKWYCEIPENEYADNPHGRDMVTDNSCVTSLHDNIGMDNSDMKLVGTFVIKSLK